jgi:hypothetical protein
MHDILVFEDTLLPCNGIAKYQGSADSTDPTAPANNIFSYSTLYKSDILNDGEFIVYYHPLYDDEIKVVPTEYDTITVDIELNPQDFVNDTSCPSNLGGSSIEELESRYATSSSNIESISSELNELVDGGDTEELNSEIQFSQPSEAIQLRQQLLDESPYLSDTVMKSAINKENVLPNAMIRDILVANPQSAKSDDVLEQLDTRFEPIPGYMMGQIINGKNTASAKENLEAILLHNKTEKAKAINELVKYYKSYTSVYAFDSTLYWLEQKNSPDAEYTRVFEYLRVGDTTNALNVLVAIPSSFNLNNYENITYQKFTNFVDVYKDLVSLQGKVWQADSASVAQLEALSVFDNYLPGVYARNILVANEMLDYRETYQLPGHLKTSEAIVYPNEAKSFEKNEYLKIFPNPTKDYMIIEYSIPTSGLLNETYILLVNNKGVLIKSLLLNEVRNTVVVNTSELLPGIYMVSLVNGNAIIGNKKLVIYE